MLVLFSLLFLGSVGCHMRNHNISNVCDDFHAPVSVFNGKYGKLMMYLGMTREEFKAGRDLKLTINNCGGEDEGVCIVKSAWKNAIFEGNRDNKYKIVLTEVGERSINKAISPMRCRGTSFPVQNYVRLRLIIDSNIADGIPKIPQVSLVSFGGIHECTPKPIRRIIGPICPRSTKCPSDLATMVQGKSLLLTLPAERKWNIEFTVAFEGSATINATVTSEKALLQHKRRCGSLHSFRLRRTWQNVRDENKKTVKVLMSIVENPIPMVTAFTSRPNRGSSCGITCGVFKGCVKPITPKPRLTTTSSLPTSTSSSVTTSTTPIPPVKPNEPLLEEEPAKPQEAVKPKVSKVSDKLEKLETDEESKKGPKRMTKGPVVRKVNGTKGRSGPGTNEGSKKGPMFGYGRRNGLWRPRKTGNGIRHPRPESMTGTRLGSERSRFDKLEDGASDDQSDKTKDGSAMSDQRRKLDELFNKLQNIMDFKL